MLNNKKLWKIHSWLGLYTGIFIAFLSITGAAAVFKKEIDVLLNPHLLKVEPGEARLSYNLLYERLKQHVIQEDTALQILSVDVPIQADDAFSVSCLKQPPKGANLLERAQGFQNFDFFMNPYTGEYLGKRDYYKSFQFYLRHLHVRFFDGLYGRPAAGIFGIALLVSTIIGFLIYGKFLKNAAFTAIRTKNFRQLFADWHKMIGVLSLCFNLMIAITGAWLGMQGYYMKWFNIQAPGTYEKEQYIRPEQDRATVFDLDAILEKTHQEFPELIPRVASLSNDGTRTVTVRGDVPGMVYEIQRNLIVFDKITLDTRYKFNIHLQDFGVKLQMVQEALHFGNFGGFWLKFLYIFLGLTTGFLAITGFYIYVDRNKKKFRKTAKSIILIYSGAIAVVYFVVLLGHFAVGANVTSFYFVIFLYTFFLLLIIRYVVLKMRKKIKKRKQLQIG